MRTDRRGFLAAIIAAPVLAKFIPRPKQVRFFFGGLGLEYFIRANRWAPDPPLTERDFILFLDEAMKDSGERRLVQNTRTGEMMWVHLRPRR